MKRFEIIENLYASKKFLKMAGGRMHLPHPTPSGFAPGHKLQKPSKESGIFQSLGTITFVLFLLKGRVKKGGGHGTMPPTLNTLLVINISVQSF